MQTYVLFFVCFVVGIVVGRLWPSKIDGTFRIDTSDPDKDLYSLDLDTPLDDLGKVKKLTFKVHHFSQN